MVVTLPPDVLLLVCEELGHKLDFRTLFNCALSSKVLVGPALLWLYRVHHQSEYFRNDEGDSELPGAQKQTWEEGVAQTRRFTFKWALLWRSIIRSSLGSTAYPYALYIRSLDLRNLPTLLDDHHFREVAFESFFAGDMAKFLKAQDTPIKKKTRNAKASYMRLAVASILELVAESITRYVSDAAEVNKATVALEDIAGDISSTALPRFVSRLSRLKSITLYDGAVLNANLATAINEHCPSFDDLTFCFCARQDVDSDFASFLGGLRPNSLQSFTAISAHGIGPETLLALNNHSGSLKTLKLNGLRSEAIKSLSFLQGCESLEVLEIHDGDGFVNLEETENDIFLEVIAWLGHCTHLQELSFKNFLSAPAILTDVCLSNNIHLRKLEVLEYPLTSSRVFHQSISQQTSLEALILKADPEGSFRDDIDTLVSAISQLRNLKELNLDLLENSDYFQSSDIRQLAFNLQNLEYLTFGGLEVTDEIWPSVGGLHFLKSFNSHALSSYSFHGLLNYISTLRPTNQGLLLSVMNQSGEYDLDDTEKTALQDCIGASVSGRFEFVLYRDPGSEFDSASD